jgi:Flp pilus assembly protein TadG
VTLLKSRGAMTTIEFAILAAVLIPLTSAIIELGLLLWTQTAIQSVASLTARCAAISSNLCSTGVPAYAVSLANNWTLSGAINTGNVTVTSTTTCNTASGTFQTVTITFPVWSKMVLKPFLPDNITVRSCYPT